MGQLDIESLDNAVVLILTYDIHEEPIGHGSGFIIDQNGTVVTNYHVIDNAYTIPKHFKEPSEKRRRLLDHWYAL